MQASATPTPPVPAPTDDDPYLWLEDVGGERALAWVRERNEESRAALATRPDFEPMRTATLRVLNDPTRIPSIRRIGAHVYNLWQDEQHRRGLWRRTTLADYATQSPRWETVLDLDALGAAERENWVWAGAHALGPAYRWALVALSRGGADATVVREFDLVEKRFRDGGFTLPEAKTDIDWYDEDTVFVATDFGPGSLTDSGYARLVKRWKRGTPLASAETVFEGSARDVSVWASVDRTPGYERVQVGRSPDFYSTEAFLLTGEGLRQRQRIDKPDDASASFWREWLLLELRSDLDEGGVKHAAGSLLAMPAEAHARGERAWQALFAPTPTCSLAGMTATREHLLLNLLDNVASRIEELRWDGKAWQRRAVAAPSPGTLGLSSLHDPLIADDPLAEAYQLSYVDFLTPDSLFLGRAGHDERQLLKQRPGYFPTEGMRVEQRFATSADGTRVPYFVVWPRGAKADGRNPTLLYGYGGFEVSLQPWYSGSYGELWYGRGGVFAVANIRGGGEFGPGWHQAAVKAGKQRSYDDFIAVAEDLVKGGVTSPERLGIMGGSNGGLLVGACFVQRPDLYRAVVCQVPLLDMRRYHKLLAGASWMAEYGDPDDPAEWDVIRRYAPYQNLKPAAAGVRYPEVLFTTSTRDDRVHPAHARKTAARLRELGHPVLYYENIEGGHGGAADNDQRAWKQALEFAYLWRQLGGTDAR